MELLATVHWVGTREPRATTLDAAITAVQNWNARKRAVLRKEHIEVAWRRLKDEGWLHRLRRVGKGRLPFQ
jgi:predicted transcriptional regulator